MLARLVLHSLKNRTASGVTAWNNENERFWTFGISNNMNQYKSPCQYIWCPSTVRLWNVEWWCKQTHESVSQWGMRELQDWWQLWCGILARLWTVEIVCMKIWLSTCECAQMKIVSVWMWVSECKCKCEGGGFSWFAPMTWFANAACCTFWWRVDIVYVGCLMD